MRFRYNGVSSYYKKQINMPLKAPSREIAVLDNPKIYPVPVELIFKRKMDKYEIKGLNGVTYFTLETHFSKDVLMDIQGNSILNIRGNKIYEGRKKERLLGRLESKNSFKSAYKYNVFYNSLLTEQEETLNFNMEEHFRSGGVYTGREDDPNSCLICKILRQDSTHYTDKLLIQIAPNVDNYFMLALCCIYVDKNLSKQDRGRTSYH